MKTIHLPSWPRRTHFEFFRRFAQPHVTLCTELEAGALSSFARQGGISLFQALTWAVVRAANAVPELRTRIRPGAGDGAVVVEHEVVHASVTVPVSGDRFTFCTLEFAPEFADFAAKASPRLRAAETTEGLDDDLGGRDDVLFLTSIPWHAFTSFSLPVYGPDDSVPRMAWGKLSARGAGVAMPVFLMVHHSLADGLHMSMFLNGLQELLAEPGKWLSGRAQEEGARGSSESSR